MRKISPLNLLLQCCNLHTSALKLKAGALFQGLNDPLQCPTVVLFSLSSLENLLKSTNFLHQGHEKIDFLIYAENKRKLWVCLNIGLPIAVYQVTS